MSVETIVDSLAQTTPSIGIPFSGALGFLDAEGEMSSEKFLNKIDDYNKEFRRLYGESDVESSFRNGLDPHKERRFFGFNLDREAEYKRRLLEYIHLGSCFAQD